MQVIELGSQCYQPLPGLFVRRFPKEDNVERHGGCEIGLRERLVVCDLDQFSFGSDKRQDFLTKCFAQRILDFLLEGLHVLRCRFKDYIAARDEGFHTGKAERFEDLAQAIHLDYVTADIDGPQECEVSCH